MKRRDRSSLARRHTPLSAAFLCFGLGSCGSPSTTGDSGVTVKDLCKADNGGCEQLCRTEEERPVCGCEPGGLLQADGKHCQGWSLPQCTDTADFVDAGLRVEYSASGGAIVLHAAPTRYTPWTDPKYLPSRYLVRAVSFDVDAGWGEQQDLSELDIDHNVECLALSRVSSHGEVLALMGKAKEPVTARKLSGGEWSAPVIIENAEGTLVATSQCVGTLDDSGNGFAVQSAGAIYGARLVAGSWSTAEILEPTTVGGYVKLASMANGNTLMLWNDRVLAWKRFIPSSGWTPASSLSSDTDVASESKLAMNARGDAVVMWWTQPLDRDLPLSLMTATFSESSGWSEPTRIADFGTSVYPTYQGAVAINHHGEALAIWRQRLSMSDDISFLFARRFVPEQGWSDAETVQDSTSGSAVSPSAALDDAGNALVTWTQRDGDLTAAWANYYLQGSGWVGAGRIGRVTDGQSSSTETHAAIDDQGRARAIWATYDPERANTSKLCESHWQ